MMLSIPLLSMSQEAYMKNVKSLRPEGTLIWDTDLVHIRKSENNFKLHNIPATRFAEELGTKMMANIVMLGFLSAVENLVHADAREVIDRDAEADGFGDVGRARLEFVGQIVVLRVIEPDFLDHFAAAHERRHRFEKLLPAVQHAARGR